MSFIIDCGEFRLPVKNMSAAQLVEFKADVAGLRFDGFKSRLPAEILDAK